jgi:hypothetical protein
MNKRIVNISSMEDLEREERQVLRRIKKQEAEIGARMKQLPEEIITVGVIKIVSGIVEGGAIKSLVGIVKRIGKNVFSTIVND